MDLLKLRGHKQTAVTVLRSSVAKFIAAKDVERVASQLQKLKDAYTHFESAHEDVLSSIEEDIDTYDEESLKFIEQEQLYIECLEKGNQYVDGDMRVVNNSVHEMGQLINIPKVELKPFDGKFTDFLPFMAIFDESVDQAPISDQAKLTRLLGYTTGKARSSIDHCSLIGGERGYNEARAILRERFGDDYTIAASVIESLQSGGSVHTAEDLRALSDQLRSAQLMLTSKSIYSELDSQHNID